MNKTLLLILLLGASFASEEASKPLNDAQQAVAKAYDGNLLKAQKAYDAYLKELTVAQGAVQKDLEKIKADLNDTKKFTKLSIAERAKAIEEIDGKIAELKKGGLGEMVVAKSGGSGGDMLGDNASESVRIISIKFGTKTKFIDLTKKLKRDVVGDGVPFEQYDFISKYSDPANGFGKTVVVEWRYGNGEIQSRSFNSGETILIPSEKAK